MPITGLEHPTSPSITLQASGNRVVRRVYQYAREDAWEAEMPAIGDLDAVATPTDGYFAGYTSSNGPAYLKVTLTYNSDGTVSNFTPGDGDTEYWAETRGEEVPIEYHPSYLVKWNYGLYYKAKGGDPPAIATFNGLLANANPAGKALAAPENDWDTMKNLASANMDGTNAVDLIDWKVTKTDPGHNWMQIKRKTKPGLEFYLRPQRVVVCRAYHRTQTAAEAVLASVGRLSTPAETFGESGGSWLVTSSNTKYDGKYWIAETEYLYSDATNALGSIGWDTEIYATTTT